MHGILIQSGSSAAHTSRDVDRGGLLAGMVTDAEGLPMRPGRRSATGTGCRYYVTGNPAPDNHVGARISAARLDRSVIGVLRRVGLLGEDWTPGELATILRCVVVHADGLTLQLNTRCCLALWRVRRSGQGRATVSGMLLLMQSSLAPGETLEEVGTSLHLSIPRLSRNRCVFGRWARAEPDPADGGAPAIKQMT